MADGWADNDPGGCIRRPRQPLKPPGRRGSGTKPGDGFSGGYWLNTHSLASNLRLYSGTVQVKRASNAPSSINLHVHRAYMHPVHLHALHPCRLINWLNVLLLSFHALPA